MKNITKSLLLLTSIILLSSCSGAKHFNHKLIDAGIIYKPDVLQGNEFDKVQVSRLQIGMNPNQVIAIMGSPSISDVFHGFQWHYINSSIINNKRITYKAIVTFDRKTSLISKIDSDGDIPENLRSQAK